MPSRDLMKRLDAPNGTFLLQRPRNGAICPGCGERVEAIWVFIPDTDPTRNDPVGCETCAQVKP